MYNYTQETYDEVIKKWEKVLDVADLPKIDDYNKKATTAQLLENYRRESRMEREQFMLNEAGPTNVMGASATSPTAGNIDYVEPVIISLIRRLAPNLMAHDFMGVQPMKGPIGLITAIRSRYEGPAGAEALFNEANSSFSATPANTGGAYTLQVGQSPNELQANSSATNSYTYGTGMSTSDLEMLGSNSTHLYPEMGISIERLTATAGGRALQASYSMELYQDLRNLHGLDVDRELANMLTTELLAEINRELVRTINVIATVGAQQFVTTPGTFDLDVDSNGRWLIEKFAGLAFALKTESAVIQRTTRRGAGNVMITTQEIANALEAAGKLDVSPLKGTLRDDGIVGNTFVGNFGKIKVHVDPYFYDSTNAHYATIGYKGATPADAGVFYCPYVPVQQMRAIDPMTYQPKMALKTRYAIVGNPFATTAATGVVNGFTGNKNIYYRRFKIINLQ